MYTYKYIHIYLYIYIYKYICVCVYIYKFRNEVDWWTSLLLLKFSWYFLDATAGLHD